MFKVTVSDAKIETKSGVSSRTGKPYNIIEQSALCSLPNGERRAITLQLEAGEQPLAPGIYEPGDSAGYVGRFGSLECSTRARHWKRVQGSK